MEKESFTYMLCSQEKTNADGTFYDIDFGGFSNDAENYKIDVLNFIANDTFLSARGYMVFLCEDLADNGSFCNSILHGNQAIITTIPVDLDSLMSTNGSTFIARNCRQKKRVRFKFVNPDLSDVTDTVDINVADDTHWVLTLKMTPI
jgi:hypothetical protein